MHDIVTRVATRQEVETILDWAGREGWNPGLSDAAAFHATDPEGFYLTLAGTEPVAAVSVVNHSADLAFLGLYLCRPEFRGKGLGMATWNAALAHAGPRTVGLDGVPAQQDNYRKSGFVLTGSSSRYEGAPLARPTTRVRPLTPEDMAAAIALDAQANGYRRERFLTAWLARDLARTSLVLEGSGTVVGFATVRRCREGVKIGPVIAPDLDGALDLIAAAGTGAQDGKVIVDLPESNTALRAALLGAGFAVPFQTARMYRGTAPVTSPLLQAIGTMELG